MLSSSAPILSLTDKAKQAHDRAENLDDEDLDEELRICSVRKCCV